MDRELDLFRRFVLALFETHERPYDYKNQRALDTYLAMQKLQINPIAQLEQLQAALPTDKEVDKSFPFRDFLYLNPITSDVITVPVVWMTCDFSRSLPKISVLLGLFTIDNDDGYLKGLGYRFETPEGQSRGGIGTHHYYHAQIIRKLRGIWFPPNQYSSWMPESQPAFPLDCESSIHLLIALLVSLYGRDEALRPLLQQRKLAKELKLYNASMKYHQFTDTMWHWMIRRRGTEDEIRYYQSVQEMENYENISRSYPGCDPVKIMPTKYGSSSPDRRAILD